MSIFLVLVLIMGVLCEGLVPCGEPKICLCNGKTRIITCPEDKEIPTFPKFLEGWRVLMLAETRKSSTPATKTPPPTSSGFGVLDGNVEAEVTGELNIGMKTKVYVGINLALTIIGSISSIIAIYKIIKKVKMLERLFRNDAMGMLGAREAMVVLEGHQDEPPIGQRIREMRRGARH